MKCLWIATLGLALMGCMPQEMTAEEELSCARAQKTKHPKQWQALKKLTPAEATAQEKKKLEDESEHNQRMIRIHSRYRSG